MDAEGLTATTRLAAEIRTPTPWELTPPRTSMRSVVHRLPPVSAMVPLLVRAMPPIHACPSVAVTTMEDGFGDQLKVSPIRSPIALNCCCMVPPETMVPCIWMSPTLRTSTTPPVVPVVCPAAVIPPAVVINTDIPLSSAPADPPRTETLPEASTPVSMYSCCPAWMLTLPSGPAHVAPDSLTVPPATIAPSTSTSMAPRTSI